MWRERTLLRRALRALQCTSVVWGLVLVPSAGAAIGVAPSISLSSSAAGANPDLTIGMTFSGAEAPKGAELDLPGGLSVGGGSIPRCPIASVTALNCPEASSVGTSTVRATAPAFQVSVSLTGTAYLMESRAGEYARLVTFITPALNGVPAGAPVAIESSIGQPAGAQRISFGGLLSKISVTSPIVADIDMRVDSFTVVLRGTGGFVSNPAVCSGGLVATATASSHEGGTSPIATSAPFSITGCDGQPVQDAPKGAPASLRATAKLTGVRSRKPALAITLRSTAPDITGARVRLPSRYLRLIRSKAVRGATIQLGVGPRIRAAVNGATVGSFGLQATDTVTIRLGAGALRAQRLRRGGRLTLTVGVQVGGKTRNVPVTMSVT